MDCEKFFFWIPHLNIISVYLQNDMSNSLIVKVWEFINDKKDFKKKREVLKLITYVDWENERKM